MNDDEKRKENKNPGNLYRNATVSPKWLTAGIVIGLVALALVLVFLVSNGGFTIAYETDGGSQIASQQYMHGDLITKPEDPVKEGYTFDGWFWDVERQSRPWDFQTDIVENDMSLYARWAQK